MPTGYGSYLNSSNSDDDRHMLVNINIDNKTQVMALVGLDLGKVSALETASIRRSEPVISPQSLAIKVNDKYYVVDYNLTNGSADGFSLDVQAKMLTFFVTARQDANLTVYLPRDLIDTVHNNNNNDADSKYDLLMESS